MQGVFQFKKLKNHCVTVAVNGLTALEYVAVVQNYVISLLSRDLSLFLSLV